MPEEQQVSECFNEALMRANSIGSISITCEFCEREHYTSFDPSCFEEGELEDLQAKSKKDPEKYIDHAEYSSVAWGAVNGKQYVIDCPCNGARKFEDFIWSHRYLISEYLNKRSESELEDAQRNIDIAKNAEIT